MGLVVKIEYHRFFSFDANILQAKPTVMDDFVRNFLIKLNMARTLDAFNTEWSIVW
jgi:hypothetical protein